MLSKVVCQFDVINDFYIFVSGAKAVIKFAVLLLGSKQMQRQLFQMAKGSPRVHHTKEPVTQGLQERDQYRRLLQVCEIFSYQLYCDDSSFKFHNHKKMFMVIDK